MGADAWIVSNQYPWLNVPVVTDRSPFDGYSPPPTREDVALFFGTAAVVFSLLWVALRRLVQHLTTA